MQELASEGSVENFSKLSSKNASVYFGDAARSLFNQRCSTVNRQSKNMTSSKRGKNDSSFFGNKGNERRVQTAGAGGRKEIFKSNSVILPVMHPEMLMSQSVSERRVPPDKFRKCRSTEELASSVTVYVEPISQNMSLDSISHNTSLDKTEYGKSFMNQGRKLDVDVSNDLYDGESLPGVTVKEDDDGD